MLKQIILLLSSAERRRGMWVVMAVLVRSVLDFAGVAALIPLLMAILRPGSSRGMMMALCGVVMLFVLLKNAMVALLARVENRFLMDVYRGFSRRMFVNYYHRGLMFLKSKSSVQLGYEVNYICYTFCLCVLAPLFRLGGEAVLVLMMVVALVVWEPLAGALLCAVLIPLSVAYILVVRRRLRSYGREELEARRKQSRTVVEAFRGYAEVEIARSFGSSLASFDQGMDAIVRSRLRMERFHLFPQFLSEAAIVAGIALLVGTGRGDVGILSGVFAVAAFRLIPAMRGILGSWATLQNASHSVSVVADGISGCTDKQEDAHPTPITFTRAIRLDNIGFSFPDGDNLFSGLNLEILRGERLGVRGASGSGKSTLFNIMLGFFRPTAGQVYIDDTPLTPANRSAWHRLVGYVPQEIFIAEGSLADNIALGHLPPDLDKVEHVLAQVQLKDWADALPQGLDTPLGEYGSRLSGGQKQRIGIARALYKEAEVLFFDEATSALDSRTEQEINAALRNLTGCYRELTMVIIAHRETSLMVCDRIFDIETGKVTINVNRT